MEQTEKRTYERPATTVVELQHRTAMLEGSPGVKATRGGYGVATDYTWD